MKNCLLQYEKASGQGINFDKLSITFSSNVRGHTKQLVSNLLIVPSEVENGKYLRLSCQVGRKRKETFAYIKKRVYRIFARFG